MSFRYTVRVFLKDASMGQAWLDWMNAGHRAAVLAAGAESAEIVRLDSPVGASACAFEVRYSFASRRAFDTYEQLHAPRLRSDGLARFGPERGVRYERSTGEVV